MAVRHAKTACRLAGSKRILYLDTLAAAYAQAGDFQDAVLTIELALESAPGAQQKELQASRERYRSGLTYSAEAPQSKTDDHGSD